MAHYPKIFDFTSTPIDACEIAWGTGGGITSSNYFVFDCSRINLVMGGTSSLNSATQGVYLSTIIGGVCNKICNATSSSIISSGYSCIYGTPTSFYNSIIASKNSQIASFTNYSTIIGGTGSIMDGSTSAGILVGSFQSYLTDAYYSAIIQGKCSKICGFSSYSTILGGISNEVNASYNSLILNSLGATVSFSKNSSILSSSQSIVYGSCLSTIIGGNCQIITNSTSSVILAGCLNTMTSSSLSGILNSQGSIICNSQYSTVISGLNSRIYNSKFSVILNGESMLPGKSYTNIYGTVSNNKIVGGCSNILAGGRYCFDNVSNYLYNYSNQIYNSRHSVILTGCLQSLTFSSSSILLGSGNCGNYVYYSSVLSGRSNCLYRTVGSSIMSSEQSAINCSSNSTIIGSYLSRIEKSSGEVPFQSAIISSSRSCISISTSYSLIVGGYKNCMCETGTPGVRGRGLLILGGQCNTIKDTVDQKLDHSAIISSSGSQICNSHTSAIIGGIGLTLSNETNVVYVPTLKINSVTQSINTNRVLVWDCDSCVRYTTINAEGVIDICEIAWGTGVGITSSDHFKFDCQRCTLLLGNNTSPSFTHGTDSTWGVVIGSGCNCLFTSNAGFIIGGCRQCVLNTSFSGIIGSRCNQVNNVFDSGIILSYCSQIGTMSCSVIVGGAKNRLVSNNGGYNVIVGGVYNLIGTTSNVTRCTVNSGVFAGLQNSITGTLSNSVIIGGCGNFIGTASCNSSIVGGQCNSLSCLSGAATILGGQLNCFGCTSCFSTIAGGSRNCMFIASFYDFIGGGCKNLICNDSKNSSIVAGTDNIIACGGSDFIGGGGNHQIYRSYQSAIIGGSSNVVGTASNRAAIIAGCCHLICCGSTASIIAGGFLNCIIRCSPNSMISGGVCNLIATASTNSFVAGGSLNIIHTGVTGSSIVSGFSNRIICGVTNSIIGAGSCNFVQCSVNNSIIGAGFCNTLQIGVSASGILAGTLNIISTQSSNSSIVGGIRNTIQCGVTGSVIIGGSNSTIQLSSNNSIISGGNCNIISTQSSNSTISGGTNNIILVQSIASTIIGGATNSITFTTSNSSIVGGFCNLLRNSSCNSSITGGYCNIISTSSNSSIISGGVSNDIYNSSRSSIVGGNSNAIDGTSNESSIISGCLNCIQNNSLRTILSGGCKNLSVCSCSSTIITGASNSVCCSNYSGIFAGYFNKVHKGTSGTPKNNAIVGGQCNNICQGSDMSVIIGGSKNLICSSDYSSIIGGRGLTISNENDVVYVPTLKIDLVTQSIDSSKYLVWDSDKCIRYTENTVGVRIDSCEIAWGTNVGVTSSNYLLFDCSCINLVMGGNTPSNRINSATNSVFLSSIIGGLDNCLFGLTSSSIIGGNCNTIWGSCYSGILGGNCLTITQSNYSTIISGCKNLVSNSADSVIIQGSCNCIKDNFNNSIINSNKSIICESLFSGIISTTQSCICNSDFSSIQVSSLGKSFDNCHSSLVATKCSCIIGKVGSKDYSFDIILGGCCNVIGTSSLSSIIGGQKNVINRGGSNVSIISSCCSFAQFNIQKSIIIGSELSCMVLDVCNSAILGGCDLVLRESKNSVVGFSTQSTTCCSNSSVNLGGYVNIICNDSTSSSILGTDCGVINSSKNSSIISSFGSCICNNSLRSSIISSCCSKIISSTNSAIIGGTNSSICTSQNSAIIGGVGLTLSNESQVVYLPELKINQVSECQTLTKFLTWDDNNNYVRWSTSGSGLGTGITGSIPYYTGTFWTYSSTNLYNNGIYVGVGLTNSNNNTYATPSSNLHVFGSLSLDVKTASSDYTLTDRNFTLLAYAPSNNSGMTVSLPQASIAKHRLYVVKKVDSYTQSFVFIEPFSGDNIEGYAGSISLENPWDYYMLQSDGQNMWIKLGGAVGLNL